jgi:hypothetical protein
MRSLAALLAEGAPLHGITITLDHTSYNWSDTSILRQAVRDMDKDALTAGSTEGGLFEYESDEDIAANLKTLHAETPDEFFMVGSIFRDERITVLMKRMAAMPFLLRELEPFRDMVCQAGWNVDFTVENNPVYRIMRLRKAPVRAKENAS